MTTLAERYAAVVAEIARACDRARRDPASVQLVAVSKRMPAEDVRHAYALGQRAFGENYVQELVGKAAELRDLVEIEWHAIGNIQRNKARDVVRTRAVIETVDSVRLLEAIAARVEAGSPRVRIFLQVNVGAEAQKSGCAIEQLPEIIAAARALPSVDLRGLMAIPPVADDPEATRPYFRKLRVLAETHGLPELSMGMSADFALAIAEGATVVRVGTAIFGARGVIGSAAADGGRA